MPYNVPLSLNLRDETARDLTRFRIAQHQNATVLAESVDDTSTNVVFQSIAGMEAGKQIYIASGELMTIVSVPATALEPVVVVRGDTSVLSNTGAKPHTLGTSCYVLRFRDLVEMGQELAKSQVKDILISLGAASETMSGFMS